MAAKTISQSSFAVLQQLMERETAIVIHDDKLPVVEMRLQPLAFELGFDSVDAFMASLSQDSPAPLVKAVVESLTTHETSFFREASLFDALRDQLIPDLLQRRSKRRKLRIWSAACASGQEPYSVAMTLLEHFPEIVSRWELTIVGSDISGAILSRAVAGTYQRHELNRGLTPTLQTKYFEPGARDWRPIPRLRRMVSWRRVNLAASLPLLEPFDIVLLRNVLIYFSTVGRQGVVRRVRPVVAEDGYLCLGGSESLWEIDVPFQRRVGPASIYHPLASR